MILFLTALLLRVGAGFAAGNWTNPAVWEYEWIADNLLEGNGYVCSYLGTTYRALCMPAYPLLSVAVYSVTNHSHTVLLALQCALSAGICLQVRSIGRLVLPDSRAAEIAGWGVAVHPGLILYATRLHTLTLDTAAFLAALWAWLRLYRSGRASAAWIAGFLSGLAILCRGTLIPFLLLAAAGLLLISTRPRKESMRRILQAALAAALVVAPWLIRNTVQFRRFPVFITTSNYAFWLGNNPISRGSAYLPDGRPVIDAAPKIQEQIAEMSELEQNRFFGEEASRFIRANPSQAVRLYFRKFFSFWWFSDQTGLLYPGLYAKIYRLYFLGILVLALGGFGMLRRHLAEPPFLLLFAFTLSIAAVQSVYYVEGRHRWTIEPVLWLFSAQGLYGVRRWILPSR